MPVELREMLLGERLQAGARLYRDLYDSTAPLAAALAGLLELVANRPLWLYRLLALALLTFQALRFNFVLNRADVHPERGYVAALIYLLIGSVSTDLDILSPLLLGHTFLIAGFSALLPTSREGYDNRRLFRAGFLIGVAALCYLPLALFLLLGSVCRCHLRGQLVPELSAAGVRLSVSLRGGGHLLSLHRFAAGIRAVSPAAHPERPSGRGRRAAAVRCSCGC